MSTFRFNFFGESDSMVLDSEKDTSSGNVILWLESYEITPDRQIELYDNRTRARLFICGDVEIGYVIATEALAKIGEGGSDVVQLAEREHSDLIPGRYEGGLKVWECTHDLIEFLENESGVSYDSKNVLDLGCGVGIVGIHAFMQGANVTFQDYNEAVIEYVTIPNVILNIEHDEDRKIEIQRCNFYSGDWASFNKKLPEANVYDYIFTSETIYRTCYYDKLITLFKQRLKKNGVVYLAAKTYYFGIGGGIREFEKAIENDGNLKSCVCWKSTGGIQREILKITHNKS